MVSLQQIKELENKVLKAVEVINSLRDENKSLRGNLQGYEKKIVELEGLVDTFKNEQQQIEKGILDAIQKLDILEDSHNAGITNDASEQKNPDTSSSDEQHSGPIPKEEEKTAKNTPAADPDEELEIF